MNLDVDWVRIFVVVVVFGGGDVLFLFCFVCVVYIFV